MDMPVDGVGAETPLPAGAYRPDRRRHHGRFNTLGFLTLLGREIKRLRKLAMLFLVAPGLSAALYFTVFAFGLGDKRGTPEGDAILAFLVPGLVTLSLLTQSVQIPSFSILYAKMEGAILDQLMAPVGAAEMLAAYVLSAMAAGVASGAAVWVGFLVFWQAPMADPALVLLFVVLGSSMMATFGVLTGLISVKWDHLSAAMTFVFTPLIFLSGLFAPVAGMPGVLRAIVQANPIYYAIDGVRIGFLGQGQDQAALAVLVLVAVNVALLAIAGTLLHRGYRLRN
ncbi:ABC transporter permease [Nitrospirillum amazonense]|uniref:Transport permease protein n=1 Tax=Nitrospirillum amazonense TaxID=28077 RepID=A0A560JW88_9PROT|nr:ABC transporter permease [Nitrospirillum amazonense]MDG3440426.1 ABC transporter permease [Nitrospirillum amazonense]TWB75236.1 ABC-2 type transport system permease protein [Nitrospirillum amazonense]